MNFYTVRDLRTKAAAGGYMSEEEIESEITATRPGR